jgi:hypothetical protein
MRTRTRTWLGVALLLALLLGVLRALLPGWMLERYRGRMQDLGGYTGSAESIEVSVLGLHYQLRGVRIARRDRAIATSLLRADVELRLHPWRGDSEVRVTGLQLHLVDGGGERASQLGAGVPWRHLLDALAPAALPVSGVRVEDATLAIVTLRAPRAPIVLDQLQATMQGLTARPDARTLMPARIDARGRLLGHAPTTLRVHFDPERRMQRMQLELQAAAIELARLDAYAHAWGGIDFEDGQADARLQLGSIDARVDGALRATLTQVDVFDAHEDLGRDGDGLLHAARELLLGGGAALKRDRDGRLEVERAVDAGFELPQDNFDGLRAAIVAGLSALDAR